MIDAATPTPEPFNGLYDFGEAAEPTSGLLPESHSGAEAPILLDWDFIDVFTAADNPSAITSSAGELDFAAAGPIHSVDGWMDGPVVPGQSVLPGADIGDASAVDVGMSEDNHLVGESASGSKTEVDDGKVMCFGCFDMFPGWETIDTLCLTCWAQRLFKSLESGEIGRCCPDRAMAEFSQVLSLLPQQYCSDVR